MVLDQHLGSRGLADLLEVAGPSIDLLKMGWGTAATMTREIVRHKCDLLREARVLTCPGGTLGELAWHQGRFGEFLAETGELGFSCVEVSDGTVIMSRQEKLDLIRQVADSGLRVISEVGFKSSSRDRAMSLSQRVQYIGEELEAGAWRVIIEARESGRQGLFNAHGTLDSGALHELLQHVPAHQLIFEAPQRSQQTELILTLGHEVNLGNVAPADVVGLETLRRGLRSDTLGHLQMSQPLGRIEWFEEAARAAAQRGDVIIVVDALRASSTIVTALAHGASSVRPVATAAECKGDLTAGEHIGRQLDHVDLDNSPLAFTNGIAHGRELVLCTTNGTRCLLAAASGRSPAILVGCALNAGAVAQAALHIAQVHHCHISIVCAGRLHEIAPEDYAAAASIAAEWSHVGMLGVLPTLDMAELSRIFTESPAGRNLAAKGKDADVAYCCQRNLFDCVPVWIDGRLKRLPSEYPIPGQP